jgi:hypothetical protein
VCGGKAFPWRLRGKPKNEWNEYYVGRESRK